MCSKPAYLEGVCFFFGLGDQYVCMYLTDCVLRQVKSSSLCLRQ